MRPRFIIGWLLTLALVGLLGGVAPAQAQEERLCFGEVPDCITGRFAEYWRQNGGLAVFGYPIGPASEQEVAGGRILVQPFERNRFELHPGQTRPYDVLLGRLGDDLLRQRGRPWEAEPKAPSSSQDGCAFFEQTGHLVCEPFLSFWRSRGLSLDGQPGVSMAESLALFGLPLTEARSEPGDDGKEYLVQWYERARLELHPELGEGVVLLGLLGREALVPPAPAPAPTPAPVAAPACAGVPDGIDAEVAPRCFLPGAIFTATGRGFEKGRVSIFVEDATTGKSYPLTFIAGSGVVENGSYTIRAAVGLQVPPAIYQIRLVGGENKHTSVGYFHVLPYDPANPPPDNTLLPPGRDATASRYEVPRDTELFFSAFKFTPKEEVLIELTDSIGQRYVGKQKAEKDGKIGKAWFKVGGSAPIGVYKVTFYGQESQHTAEVFFRVLP